MPNPEGRREDTLVLANGTYLYLLAGDSGRVNIIVGPYFQQGLKQTDIPVTWDPARRNFVKRTSLEDATQIFTYVPDGSYAVLTNPSAKPGAEKPGVGVVSAPVELREGFKIVIKGPESFPLWPGQEAKVIEGHRLQPNNYLLLTVTNETEAKKNWPQAVVVSQAAALTGQVEVQQSLGRLEGEGVERQKGDGSEALATGAAILTGVKSEDLVMGKRFTLKGTDASFFIPPTGVEVVPDSSGQYVRTAETLASMEYVILRDVNGNERYVPGPATVFPAPTEDFVTENGSRKFRAIELNPNMGIHVKVIEDFDDEHGRHKVGDELFITGKDQAIFWPRREIVVVKYGSGKDGEFMHYAVAVPEGDGRYVLDKKTGRVELVKGPDMLLLQPMDKIFVQRALSQSLVRLLYPGNDEVLEVNRCLSEIAATKLASEPILQSELTASSVRTREAFSPDELQRSLTRDKAVESPGSTVTRRPAFTPPRTVRLDRDKFSGAVGITVFNQYAVLVANSAGNQRVEVGPTRVLLEYDETVMPVTLSTGTPKSDDNPIQTAYLRIRNNRVSDKVRVTTKDLCEVDVHLSYRVDFTGDDRQKWFAVENPIQFLVDHLRSIIRGMVRDHGIQEFYDQATTLIRDSILGSVPKEQGQKRPGKLFVENGMHVTDVEVLTVKIADPQISTLLTTASQGSVQRAIQQLEEGQKLSATITGEERKRILAHAQAETVTITADLEINKAEKEAEARGAKANFKAKADLQEQESVQRVATLRFENESDIAHRRLEVMQQQRKLENDIEILRRESVRLDAVQKFELAKQELENALKRMEAEDKSLSERMKAITPDLIKAMMQLGDESLMEKLTNALGPIALIGGSSVAEVAAKFFKGTPLEEVMKTLGSRIGVVNGNGHETREPASTR